jgi:hypothetical protein
MSLRGPAAPIGLAILLLGLHVGTGCVNRGAVQPDVTFGSPHSGRLLCTSTDQKEWSCLSGPVDIASLADARGAEKVEGIKLQRVWIILYVPETDGAETESTEKIPELKWGQQKEAKPEPKVAVSRQRPTAVARIALRPEGAPANGSKDVLLASLSNFKIHRRENALNLQFPLAASVPGVNYRFVASVSSDLPVPALVLDVVCEAAVASTP